MSLSTVSSQSNIAYGSSLLTNEPIAIQGFPEASATQDRYVGPSAISPDVKAVGSPAHQSVVKKIEAIADNPAMTDKQKRAAINEIRKQFGLSKGDMKKYFTKPLERATAREIEQLKMSGIDTPEKAMRLQELEMKKKLYASMYKPGGCIKKTFGKIGGFFKNVGKIALGVASAVFNPLSLIPVVGQIPMVGKIVNTVSGAFSKAKAAVDGVVGKVSGWVDQGVGYYQRGVNLYRQASEMPKRWLEDAKNLPWF